ADAHLAGALLLQAAGDGQQRGLPRSARSHHRHHRARVDRQVDVAQRVHLGGPPAVGARHAPHFQHVHFLAPTLLRTLSTACLVPVVLSPCAWSACVLSASVLSALALSALALSALALSASARSAAARLMRPSAASSHRTTASSRKSSASTT